MVDEKEMSQHIYSLIVMLAWKDPEFKKSLVENPRVALKEVGVDLPEGIELDVHLQTPLHLHLIIPERPPEFGELSEEEMRKYAGWYDRFQGILKM